MWRAASLRRSATLESSSHHVLVMSARPKFVMRRRPSSSWSPPSSTRTMAQPPLFPWPRSASPPRWFSSNIPDSESSDSNTDSSYEDGVSAMEKAQTLDEVLAAIEQQSYENELRRDIEKPTPWLELLHHPSRAAWRATDHVLEVTGAQGNNIEHDEEEEEEEGDGEDRRKLTSPLSQTQFNLIRHSERTNKQLKRTYKRIMETHKSLAVKRERERRMAANLSKPKSPMEDGNADGAIADEKGRQVGSWRDKQKKRKDRMSNSEYLCDDPSVALALSMGLSGSKGLPFDTELENDENNNFTSNNFRGRHVKSAKNASKLARSKDSNKDKPVAYSSEQALTNVRYRLGPNYSIVRRVLMEVQSLLGGNEEVVEGGSKKKKKVFRPKRVLDFGSGVGSASAAALDVFGIPRSADTSSGISNGNGYLSSTARNGSAANAGIDWIHSIDASKSMRETTKHILTTMLETCPWDAPKVQTEEERLLQEELAEYERLLKGEPSKKQMDRRQKRMAQWEQSWVKKTNARTRLTFGESLVDASSFFTDNKQVVSGLYDKGGDSDYDDVKPALPWQKQLDEQRRKVSQKKSQSTTSSNNSQKGTFDLILCSYTLSELPNVPSSLAASALLWEKLAPNGVLVFVEPGTPDGFGILRSVRSALLECCPPPELKRRRGVAAEGDGDENGEWPEECHVIAPCTHNGSCPMSRHQRNHVKKNRPFGKYEADGSAEGAEEEGKSENAVESAEYTEASDDNDIEEDDDEDDSLKGILDEWKEMNREEKDEVKLMLGDGRKMSDEEVVHVLKMMEEMEEGEDDNMFGFEEEEEEESDSDEEEDDDDFYQKHEEEYYNIDQPTADEGASSSNKKSSTMAKTDVFDTSFCSFVHSFPGNMRGKRGEKFTYLVLQKRVPGKDDESNDDNDSSSATLDEVDIVEMLSKSVHHSQKLKKEELRKRIQQRRINRNGMDDNEDMEIFDNHHREQSYEILQQAVEVKDAYLDSTQDRLGLELLHGDDRRKGWGRLIRAPLKRKGHVLLDYCSASCGGCSKKSSESNSNESDDNTLSDGTKGRITRQKISRGWSARAAPGSYSAARRARWGGLWPDLSERVKLAAREDKKDRERKMQEEIY